jgi:hypothetical protein
LRWGNPKCRGCWQGSKTSCASPTSSSPSTISQWCNGSPRRRPLSGLAGVGERCQWPSPLAPGERSLSQAAARRQPPPEPRAVTKPPCFALRDPPAAPWPLSLDGATAEHSARRSP